MKLRQLSIIILLATMLSGCTNTTFNKSIDEIKTVLSNTQTENQSEQSSQDVDSQNKIEELINIDELSIDQLLDKSIELYDEISSKIDIYDIKEIILNGINTMLEELSIKLSEN